MPAPLDRIHAIYAAFATRDFDTVLAAFHPDIEWVAAEHSPLADQSPYQGLEAVRGGVFDRIRMGFHRLAIEATELIEAGDRVIVLGHYEGLRTGMTEPFRAQVAHVWTFEGDRVRRFQQYLDTLQLALVMKA